MRVMGLCTKLAGKLVNVCKVKYGNEHPDVAKGLNNLAGLLKAQVWLAGFCC